MTDSVERAPMHLWIVGILSLPWNAFGTYDYVMTQMRDADYLAQFTAEQRAYFDGFPWHMEMAWAFGVWGALLGSLLLVLRNRFAVHAFAVSLLGLAVSTLWQFVLSGDDVAAIMPEGAGIMTGVIWAGALCFLAYSLWCKNRGWLR